MEMERRGEQSISWSIVSYCRRDNMEDEDKHLLMMIQDIKEGQEDIKRLLEP